MTVVHNGVTHQVTVEPGPDGRERFQAEIRRIFNLGENDAIQLTFGCRVPGTGEWYSHWIELINQFQISSTDPCFSRLPFSPFLIKLLQVMKSLWKVGNLLMLQFTVLLSQLDREWRCRMTSNPSQQHLAPKEKRLVACCGGYFLAVILSKELNFVSVWAKNE